MKNKLLSCVACLFLIVAICFDTEATKDKSKDLKDFKTMKITNVKDYYEIIFKIQSDEIILNSKNLEIVECINNTGYGYLGISLDPELKNNTFILKKITSLFKCDLEIFKDVYFLKRDDTYLGCFVFGGTKNKIKILAYDILIS